MILDCWRKLEYPERIHACKGRTWLGNIYDDFMFIPYLCKCIQDRPRQTPERNRYQQYVSNFSDGCLVRYWAIEGSRHQAGGKKTLFTLKLGSCCRSHIYCLILQYLRVLIRMVVGEIQGQNCFVSLCSSMFGEKWYINLLGTPEELDVVFVKEEGILAVERSQAGNQTQDLLAER